jgi:hypothetical protein
MTLSGERLQLAAPRRGSRATHPRVRARVRVSLLKENKAIQRRACSCLDFEALPAGTVFREPRPTTSAADRGFGGRSRQIHFVDLAMQRAARPAIGLSTTLFFHSGNTLAVLMPAMSV